MYRFYLALPVCILLISLFCSPGVAQEKKSVEQLVNQTQIQQLQNQRNQYERKVIELSFEKRELEMANKVLEKQVKKLRGELAEAKKMSEPAPKDEK